MKKKLEDYVNLYTGCKVYLPFDSAEPCINLGNYYPEAWTKEGRVYPNGIVILFPKLREEKNRTLAMNYGQCKLMLRTLDSMTPEERIELNPHLFWNGMPNGQLANTALFPAEMNWLLKNNFDIFGLIGAGLAVDINKPLPAKETFITSKLTDDYEK